MIASQYRRAQIFCATLACNCRPSSEGITFEIHSTHDEVMVVHQFNCQNLLSNFYTLLPSDIGAFSSCANRSITSLTNSVVAASTSITLRFFSRRPLNSSGRTSFSKSKWDEFWRARVTASENLAGCAVDRTICTVEDSLRI